MVRGAHVRVLAPSGRRVARRTPCGVVDARGQALDHQVWVWRDEVGDGVAVRQHPLFVFAVVYFLRTINFLTSASLVRSIGGGGGERRRRLRHSVQRRCEEVLADGGAHGGRSEKGQGRGIHVSVGGFIFKSRARRVRRWENNKFNRATWNNGESYG